MKHTSKNNSPELPGVTTAGQKPITGAHATAAQLSALGFADLDETFLRNRAAEGVIPRPIRGQWDINATTLGLLKWYRARAIVKSDLPAQYANMQAMENALGTNKKAIKWLLKNGAGEAQDPANRIAPLPLLRCAFDFIARVSEGSVTGIDGVDEWNKDTELAKKLRLESDKLEDEALLRRGEMLLSRDGTYAIEGLVADELIWEKRDQPLRAALIAAPKAINRQHRTILKTAHVPEPIITRLGEITMAALNTALAKVRTKTPNMRHAIERKM